MRNSDGSARFTFDAAEFLSSSAALADRITSARGTSAASTAVVSAVVDIPVQRSLDDAPTTAIRRVVAPPVFVDESGRRRRWIQVLASVGAVVCAVYVAVVGISVVHRGNGDPWSAGGLLPPPAAAVEPPAQAETLVRPAVPAVVAPVGRVATRPSATPSAAPAIAAPDPTPSVAGTTAARTSPRASTQQGSTADSTSDAGPPGQARKKSGSSPTTATATTTPSP